MSDLFDQKLNNDIKGNAPLADPRPKPEQAWLKFNHQFSETPACAGRPAAYSG